MPKHFEKKVINYSAKQMFDLVLDVENYPNFIKWCSSSRIIERKNKSSFIAELQVSFKSISETYQSLVTCDEEKLTIDVLGSKGPFNRLNNAWKFKVLSDNTCLVEFDLDYEFKSKILANIMNLIFFPAVKSMVRSFEKRAKEVYS